MNDEYLIIINLAVAEHYYNEDKSELTLQWMKYITMSIHCVVVGLLLTLYR